MVTTPSGFVRAQLASHFLIGPMTFPPSPSHSPAVRLLGGAAVAFRAGTLGVSGNTRFAADTEELNRKTNPMKMTTVRMSRSHQFFLAMQTLCILLF
jgi:hypothetical protein